MGQNKQTMKGKSARRARGQGMVEFALSLPLLLLVLAGLVEIANLVLLYARMETVTRESSRFGALGGTDTSVREVFFQSARDSLETQSGVIELWVVRPILDFNEGTQTYSWKGATEASKWGVDGTEPVAAVCVYPESGCENQPEWLNEQSQDILNQIKNSGATRNSAAGDRFVIAVTYYEARTILNLPFYQVPGGEKGRVPLKTVSIYRQEVAQETVNMLAGGCTALPIMINMNALAKDNIRTMNPEADARHIAREGTIFELTREPSLAWTDDEEALGTKYDFLAWQYDDQEASQLNASLDFPGNIESSEFGYAEPYEHARNYETVDRMLNLGDPVAAKDSGVWADINVLNHLEYTGKDAGGFRRAIRIILSNGKSQETVFDGPNADFRTYKVMGFAIVHVLSYEPNGILKVEFVRFDKSCGEAKAK